MFLFDVLPFLMIFTAIASTAIMWYAIYKIASLFSSKDKSIKENSDNIERTSPKLQKEINDNKPEMESELHQNEKDKPLNLHDVNRKNTKQK